jgi:hypothetical protein
MIVAKEGLPMDRSEVAAQGKSLYNLGLVHINYEFGF